jgi:hypothetical protein
MAINMEVQNTYLKNAASSTLKHYCSARLGSGKTPVMLNPGATKIS